MSAHLRPTAPPPPTEPGKVVLDPAAIDRALEAAGLAGVGVYCRIVACAQYHEPCTITRLLEMCGDPDDDVCDATATLIEAGMIAWVEEPGEGGAA